MTGIRERLRHWAKEMRPSGLGGFGNSLSSAKAPLLDEAADEIERLRAALQEISDLTAFYEPWAAIARKALGEGA